jgi:hypothetical protein
VNRRSRELRPPTFVRRHYLGRLLATVWLPSHKRAILIAISSYVIFLLAAAWGPWRAVVGSFLHIWQITFSITLFFGIWFCYEILNSIKFWLIAAKSALLISVEDYSDISRSVKRSLRSTWSLGFAILFIIPGITVAVLIRNSVPNVLFPFPGNTPAFLYSVFIEFCTVMLVILGAGCWVIIFVFSYAARLLSQSQSIKYDQVDVESLSYLSGMVLKNCIYMLVAISSAMPGVAYVAFSFGNRRVAYIATIFGMVLPTLGIASSFFAPNYYLSKILKEAKARRISRIKHQIRVCELSLETKVTNLSENHLLKLDTTCERLGRLSDHFRGLLIEVKGESTWPFKSSALIRLGGSTLLPALTFFLERILKSVFP